MFACGQWTGGVNVGRHTVEHGITVNSGKVLTSLLVFRRTWPLKILGDCAHAKYHPLCCLQPTGKTVHFENENFGQQNEWAPRMVSMPASPSHLEQGKMARLKRGLWWSVLQVSATYLSSCWPLLTDNCLRSTKPNASFLWHHHGLDADKCPCSLWVWWFKLFSRLGRTMRLVQVPCTRKMIPKPLKCHKHSIPLVENMMEWELPSWVVSSAVLDIPSRESSFVVAFLNVLQKLFHKCISAEMSSSHQKSLWLSCYDGFDEIITGVSDALVFIEIASKYLTWWSRRRIWMDR